MGGTLYCIMIKFIGDNRVSYFNGKPFHHCYHSPTKLGAKKWKTIAGAQKWLSKLPNHANQTFWISEV